jgi:hypothetical protein
MHYKTLEERYSREQTLKCALIYSTYDFGYCPIVFINPYGFRVAHSGDNILIHHDLKAEYMLEVWKKAKENTDKKFFSWNEAKWYFNSEDYFKKLIFYKYSNIEKAKKFFWAELKRSSNEGNLYVEESFSINGNNKKWIINSLGSYTDNTLHNLPEENPVSPIKRTWSWNDIKDFFIEISEEEIEFIHGENLNQCTVKDLSLFDACYNADLKTIKELIKDGANVNALDYDGEGCLAKLLEQKYFEDDLTKEEFTSYCQTLKNIIDFLLSQGLNINLYGFGGTDAILQAHWIGSVDLMIFLVERGAKLNQNCNITDLGDFWQNIQTSSIYDYVLSDIAIGDYDTETLLKEKEFLEKHNVSFYIEGWNREKISNLHSYLNNIIKYD